MQFSIVYGQAMIGEYDSLPSGLERYLELYHRGSMRRAIFLGGFNVDSWLMGQIRRYLQLIIWI